ncbi:uncharacterized protein FTJAE_13506 [Fusarium tjaetaba]|uniref:Uncharacterized protein n=1 Tax=Fusarium tjaetaba TaxID=1567544 RepID=A0A8H5VBB9_9HYPO|nr:uncharacterized protein FTJAE_13506 [Fusarium tjaetaba]KAF5615004.1 hypothetical protein FTJAE_13506 [Fusarium tjaetaba]
MTPSVFSSGFIIDVRATIWAVSSSLMYIYPTLVDAFGARNLHSTGNFMVRSGMLGTAYLFRYGSGIHCIFYLARAIHYAWTEYFYFVNVGRDGIPLFCPTRRAWLLTPSCARGVQVRDVDGVMIRVSDLL